VDNTKTVSSITASLYNNSINDFYDPNRLDKIGLSCIAYYSNGGIAKSAYNDISFVDLFKDILKHNNFTIGNKSFKKITYT